MSGLGILTTPEDIGAVCDVYLRDKIETLESSPYIPASQEGSKGDNIETLESPDIPTSQQAVMGDSEVLESSDDEYTPGAWWQDGGGYNGGWWATGWKGEDRWWPGLLQGGGAHHPTHPPHPPTTQINYHLHTSST